jgi:uncharacterized membrane protein
MHGLWVLIHLVAAMVWIGGMVFAVGCLRPAAAVLAPADRLAMMSRVVTRFLDFVAIAVIALWASGLGLFAATPLELVPVTWWVMVAIAVAMTAVFLVLRLRLLPALHRAREVKDTATAAAVLGRMHRLVVANLVLGLLTAAQIKLF